MGYTTEFDGYFEFNKPLDAETLEFLKKFNATRRMARNVDGYGIEGEFYVDGGGYCGQDQEDNIIDYNRQPRTQPSLWCQWRPSDDGTTLAWDGDEKFYNYVEWLEYLIENILAPRGYEIHGVVEWQCEDREDIGQIEVKHNKVKVLYGRIIYE